MIDPKNIEIGAGDAEHLGDIFMASLSGGGTEAKQDRSNRWAKIDELLIPLCLSVAIMSHTDHASKNEHRTSNDDIPFGVMSVTTRTAPQI